MVNEVRRPFWKQPGCEAIEKFSELPKSMVSLEQILGFRGWIVRASHAVFST